MASPTQARANPTGAEPMESDSMNRPKCIFARPARIVMTSGITGNALDAMMPAAPQESKKRCRPASSLSLARNRAALRPTRRDKL